MTKLDKALKFAEKLNNRMNGYTIGYWKKGKGSGGLIPRIYVNGKELNPKKWTHFTLVWDNKGASLDDYFAFKKRCLTFREIKQLVKGNKFLNKQ